jgi:alpha-L-fucosidase 2
LEIPRLSLIARGLDASESTTACSHRSRLSLVCALCLAFLASLPAISAAQSTAQNSLLWYAKPAPVWTEALPIGNGRMGAMVFGGANTGANNGDLEDAAKNKDILDGHATRMQDEHLQLNEDTIWQGSRIDRLNPEAHEGFQKVRALLLESNGTDGVKISQAEKIAARTMISNPHVMPGYSTLGDLYLRSASGAAITGYRRELNLNTGVARVTFTMGHVRYVREVFASAPDRVIVMRLTASKPASLSFSLTMDRPDDFSVRAIGDRDLVLTQGPSHKDQINFQGQVRVVASGGSVHEQDQSIVVSEANEVTLLIAAATDFKGGAFSGENPSAQCAAVLDAAAKKAAGQLRSAAVADGRKFMDRVSLHLGATNTALEALPTDERLRRVSAGENDFGLQALYFQYARYLLVGSSRPGGLAANLQGLWASGVSNPWGSKWTININTEMNYWVAEAANLGDLHAPLFDLVDMVRQPGSGTGVDVAQKYYGARGFVIHHNTDIWGDANPIDGVPYGIWPMGGAWMSLDAWDHFAFSGDQEFLQKRAWPQLHDASLFFLDYLVDDGHGHLITGPSLSPENRYKLADGSTHSLTMGPTMDIEIVRELFQRTIQASEVLGDDPEFRLRLKTAMEKLPPFAIGKLGNLQEWQTDYTEAAIGHRHISHLWALFPGTQITPQHTPELAKAAQVALERRLQAGGGQTGWSRAWVVNYWDHLRDGEQAYDSMQVLFRQSTFPNLMDTHPPGVFQIDGNLGAANGMLDALVQSRWYADHAEVDLLPALPKVWNSGSISGVRVRGGATVDMHWSAGIVTTSTWKAAHYQTFELRVPAGQHLRELRIDGKIHKPASMSGDVLHLSLAQGKSYQLTF